MITAHSVKLPVPGSTAQLPMPPTGGNCTRPPSGALTGRRRKREWSTLSAMVRCYCQDHHEAGPGLCAECRGLLDYATLRLERCRFGEEKPTCAKCPVHCYQRDWREQMKAVMRYAGPRMLWQHPILSLRHWLDGLRRAPQL
ncbi:MAG TPA: nitrous oxide-stimulated promoter family protein [Candidatus Acidoferrum sp.]|nr:nitrous oxide-stimulated promoter family protein [Candidatus Acidoferrum sp.]